MDAQVCSLREVLPEQAIGVLVGAALPRTGRIAEVNGDVCPTGEILVARHFSALIPSEGTPEMGR